MAEKDIGFMWHLTSGANYRITGNESSCVRNLYAASYLFSRYNVAGEYINAWPGKGNEGYSIIDCMMNLSQLYWASEELADFCAPDTPVYYDSTAGVCAACGIIELAKYVSEDESRYFIREAIHILKAGDEHFCSYDDNQDAIVFMGTERYPHDESQLKGVHIPIIYGDFFFVEAMFKLKGNDFLIW